MRPFSWLMLMSLAAVGCSAPTAAGRSPLPAPPLGAPGAPGTSRADLDRIVRDMDMRLTSAPADVAAAVRLADALLRQARVLGHAAPAAKAERALRVALGRDARRDSPSRYQAQRLLAAALLSQHRFDDAIRQAEQCLQIRPDDPVPHGIIGDARLELGDRDSAFESFDRMAALRPDAASYARVAYARELSGDLADASRVMAMALEATSPNDTEALAWHRAQLGALEFRQGRLNGAAREFDHAVALFPGYPLAIEGQARVAHARGRHAQALTLIEQLTLDTPSSTALSLSADVLRALGRSDEATRRDALAAAARASEGSR